jgi:hypothetical protein
MQQKSQTTHSICKLEFPHPNPITKKIATTKEVCKEIEK